jgi:hypothetical protein
LRFTDETSEDWADPGVARQGQHGIDLHDQVSLRVISQRRIDGWRYKRVKAVQRQGAFAMGSVLRRDGYRIDAHDPQGSVANDSELSPAQAFCSLAA